MKQKKILEKKKLIKMADSKKTHFSAPPIFNIFYESFTDWSLAGLVELIDAKGIGVAQLIWL